MSSLLEDMASRPLLEGQVERSHLPPAQGTFQEQQQGWECWQVSNHGTMTSQQPDAKSFPWDEGRQKSLWSCPGMLSCLQPLCLPDLMSCCSLPQVMPSPGNQTPTGTEPRGAGRHSSEIPSVAQIHFPISLSCGWESSKRLGYKGSSSL